MDSQTPSASWHPALMPNSNAESFASHSHAEPARQHEPEPEPEPTHHEEHEDTTNNGISDEIANAEETNHGTFLDKHNFDGTDEAGTWDISNEGAGAPEAADAADEQPDSTTHDDMDIAEHEASVRAAKHSSTLSFTRTVPHEVNWNDDDDAEWNLHQSEPDPFKFMPPTERTNSFPPVPPVESVHHDEQANQPAQAAQAHDFLEDSEHDDAQPASEAFEAANDVDGKDETQYIGGDTIGAEEEASDSRYEEGLPLIPPTEPTDDPGAQTSQRPGSGDPFAEEAGDEGDDFFSQIQSSENQPTDHLESQTLQRKDTSMFVSAADSHSPLSNTFEPETPTVPEDTGKPDVEGTANGTTAPGTVDVEAKWAAAFADDDEDFFLEDPVADKQAKVDIDPIAFFGDDDPGFLEDTPDDLATQPLATTPAVSNASMQQPSVGINGRYAPSNLSAQPQPLPNAYNSLPTPSHPSFVPPVSAPPPQASAYGAPPPPAKPSVSKAQSFVDKAKGGYQSPYDLPMDLAPKKRISTRQLHQPNHTAATPPPPASTGPPRSMSMNSQAPPHSGASVSSLSPPSSSHSNQLGPMGHKPPPQLKPKASFFEDLPMTSKVRPVSRQSSAHSQSPQLPPYTQPPAAPQGLPRGPSYTLPPPAATPPTQPASQAPLPGVASLVAPERVSPYASLQSSTQPKPAAPTSNRYSPAPAANGVPPVAGASNRYSPAPPGSRASSGGYSPAPPPVLSHLPRTSSPLAHFEIHRESRERSQNSLPSPHSIDGTPLTRPGSSQYEPRLNKKPSLPPTREVEEEGAPLSPPVPRIVPDETWTSPRQATHTPPPLPTPSASSTLSPPKRSVSQYAPLTTQSTAPTSFVPPPRSQTQSPGALYGRPNPIPRPLSAHGPTSPRSVSNPQPSPVVTRPRGASQRLNLIAPTDGRENDPLQRWKGAPLISWGVGGNIVTTFPKDIPRYGGVNQMLPMITRSPGEVKVRHVKDIQPLEDRLSKFPGPLRGKSKKKETIAWLSAGIETLERSLPNVAFHQTVSHEDKRAIERVLLWKILRVFVEFDGVLEGNPNVDKAVREILTPGIDGVNGESVPAADLSVLPSAVTSMQSDAADCSAVEQIRSNLLVGDREKAVWAAVDKRLWGHAMLISNTVPGDLYKQVAQEFIRKEVNHPGHSNESLAALYGVLSGNFEESVDELVPVHARAGLQLMSTSASATESKDALAGLDKWRETLGLVLSNRSVDDSRALSSLGNLLSGYGRAEAAHICFIFARQHAVFGGLDDPIANFVLLGADHRRQADQFAKETEALLLSEVYEYGLSLAGGLQGCPHLATYKLQHAMTLAEYGFRDKALQYCEAIMGAITAQTKRSPYYHPALESSVDDLMKRLKLAPREESSSWIPKPTMNQVSNTMWNRFNKFVAGEDNEGSGAGLPAEGAAESGPFARIAGGTPTISPSPSVQNFDIYGSSAGHSQNIPATATSSRYAPMAGQPSTSPYAPSSYAPRSSMERTSTDIPRSSYELSRPGQEPSPQFGSFSGENNAPSYGYQPAAAAAPQASPYAPSTQGSAPIAIPSQSSYTPYEPYAAPGSSQPYSASPAETKSQAAVESSSNSGYQPPYGYEPPSMNSFEPPSTQADQPAASTGGYEPPSYQSSSFEPPSYQPGPNGNDSDDDKPKKKSFMDDDDDDMPGLRKPQEKSKSDKDRENEEMFRRVAEEEAKRAAEAKAAPKKGWFSGWLGGGSKKETPSNEMPSNKPIRAKLGEENNFVFDPELKRWINKKPGAENTPAKTATPPPPRAASRNGSATPPPPGSTSAPPGAMGGLARPPPAAARTTSNLVHMASSDSLAPPGPALGGPPTMMRSASNMSNVSSASGPPSAVPSRPATSLSNASSIDDLLGAPGSLGRKAGGKKPRKSGRYVDVMAK